jgi:hypothetical protein
LLATATKCSNISSEIIPRENGTERASTPPGSLGTSPGASIDVPLANTPLNVVKLLHRGTSMSIAGILTSTFLQNQLSGASSPYQKQIQQLSQDLKSGNLSSAQSDFATLQAAFSQSATTSASTPTSTSNPVSQAFNQLATDLRSGNLSAAQKDLSTVQQDLKSPGSPATNHFHHSHIGGGSGDSNTQNSLLQDLSQVGQSLTSSNLAGAQQAYATLQQELQQFALGGGALSSQSSTLLAQQPLSLEA